MISRLEICINRINESFSRSEKLTVKVQKKWRLESQITAYIPVHEDKEQCQKAMVYTFVAQEP